MKKNKHNIKVGSKIERTNERIKKTQEVFTPMELVEMIIDDIPLEKLKNPNSKFLDNSAGSGNFIVGLKNRLCLYHPEEHVINNMLYAVELMPDNHQELCERIGVTTYHAHYVCANALTYDYSFENLMGLEKFFL